LRGGCRFHRATVTDNIVVGSSSQIAAAAVPCLLISDGGAARNAAEGKGCTVNTCRVFEFFYFYLFAFFKIGNIKKNRHWMFMSATLRANIFGVTSCLKGEGGGGRSDWW